MAAKSPTPRYRVEKSVVEGSYYVVDCAVLLEGVPSYMAMGCQEDDARKIVNALNAADQLNTSPRSGRTK